MGVRISLHCFYKEEKFMREGSLQQKRSLLLWRNKIFYERGNIKVVITSKTNEKSL